jgi:metal-dependent amidase/aminoacylase/carboxypeptidase family protein
MNTSQMIAWRRDFHHYPEAGWAEFRTTAKIGEFLSAETVMGRSIDVEAEKQRAQSQGASAAFLARLRGLRRHVAYQFSHELRHFRHRRIQTALHPFTPTPPV